MAHCSPLEKVVTGVVEVENIDEAVVADELERAFGENPTTSDGEKRLASPDAVDIMSEGFSMSENSRTYYFRSLTITVGKINKMLEKGYFPKGGARAPGAEIVPEPNNDEVVVYEDFFCH
jgi:hypothetical protein